MGPVSTDAEHKGGTRPRGGGEWQERGGRSQKSGKDTSGKGSLQGQSGEWWGGPAGGDVGLQKWGLRRRFRALWSSQMTRRSREQGLER